MSQRVFNSSPTPDVHIRSVLGNLTIKGWDNNEISLKSAAEDQVEFDQTADRLTVDCQGDCVMRLPVGASVRVDQVNGEAHIKLLEEPLSVDQVEGSLILSYVAGVNVVMVRGELLAKRLTGDLQVEHVEGNASIKDAEGVVRLNQVDGNLDVRGIEGSLYARVDGNARLRLTDLEGPEVHVTAEGNLICRMSANASAQVNLSSGSGKIHLSTPEGKSVIEASSHSLTLGEGESQVTLSAEGNLSFSTLEDEWDEAGEAGVDAAFSAQIADQIGRQVEAQMKALNRQFEEQMAHLSSVAGQAGISAERMEQIMKRARETSERAAARAQEKMRRAQEKVERKLEIAQRKAEARARAAERRGARSWSVNIGSPYNPPAASEPKEPVSDEERLMILRMLEEKKISLDEAERLLAALEGKEE